MLTAEQLFLSALGYEIFGADTLEQLKTVVPEQLPEIYKLSKKHDLCHLVADALCKAGVIVEETEAGKRFIRERDLAVLRYRQLKYELDRLCDTLESAKIPFLPLKGSVLRDYYPEPWMRTSCDIDILVRESELESAISVICEKLKYTQGKTGNHDVTLHAPSGMPLELHFSLTADNSEWEALLSDCFSAVKDGKGYQYEMTPELFYFYHIAHMAIHMRSGGCGVKPLIDLYVMKDKMNVDPEKRDELLRRGGLLEFERESLHLANCWFANESFTEVSLAYQSYLLRGGVYGTVGNKVAVEQVKRGGKAAYILSRIFVRYDELSIKYPTLKKRKALFPLYQFYRWFDLFFTRDSRKRASETIAKTYATADEKISDTESLFNALKI